MNEYPLSDEACKESLHEYAELIRLGARPTVAEGFRDGWKEARRRVHHIVRHAIKSQEENKRLRDLLGEAIDCGYVDNPTPTWLEVARAALEGK